LLLQTARAAASDDGVEDADDADVIKLPTSMSKKTVVSTKMVQRWSTALSVSSVTRSF